MSVEQNLEPVGINAQVRRHDGGNARRPGEPRISQPASEGVALLVSCLAIEHLALSRRSRSRSNWTVSTFSAVLACT